MVICPLTFQDGGAKTPEIENLTLICCFEGKRKNHIGRLISASYHKKRQKKEKEASMSLWRKNFIWYFILTQCCYSSCKADLVPFSELFANWSCTWIQRNAENFWFRNMLQTKRILGNTCGNPPSKKFYFEIFYLKYDFSSWQQSRCIRTKDEKGGGIEKRLDIWQSSTNCWFCSCVFSQLKK